MQQQRQLRLGTFWTIIVRASADSLILIVAMVGDSAADALHHLRHRTSLQRWESSAPAKTGAGRS
jgi:hypothetical protein